MDAYRDLRTVYLALEEAEVLRDIGDDWSSQDTEEYGINFDRLLQLREFVLEQDYSTNLGFRNLLNSVFPPHCKKLLTEDERKIWESIEANLDFSNFALAMEYLVTKNIQSLKETVFDEFLLEELSDCLASKELKREIIKHFNDWVNGQGPTSLIESLPNLASVELAKLRSLKA